MKENTTSQLKLATILAPIDFSDGSKKSLQYAVHFARQFGAEIVLLHVFRRNGGGENLPASRLKAWAEEFVPNEIRRRTEIVEGVEAIEIIEAAKTFRAGLMVISTHGRTGRAHALAGSLAENLVQLAPCPVLVVREHEYDFIQTAKSRSQGVSEGSRGGGQTRTAP